MKQAILITAYKDLILVKNIIDWFDADFDFYIHIDKKSKESYDFLRHYSNVHLFQTYRIQWGSDQHLLAILHLIRAAIESGEQYSYVHLITGTDLPIKSPKEFKSFFSVDNHINYIEYHALPRVSWGGEGGLDRIRYYWFGIRCFYSRGWYRHILKWMLKIQRKLHLYRDLSFESSFYGGGTYWSLTMDAVRYLHMRMSDRSYLKHYLHSSVAEEIWAQTLLLTAPQFEIENNSKRFMRWIGNAASPTFLTDEDYKDIICSDAFFARKIKPYISDHLCAKIRQL